MRHERDVTIERIDEKEELGLLVRVTRAAGQVVSRNAILLFLDVDDKRRCSNVFYARAVLFDRNQVLQKEINPRRKRRHLTKDFVSLKWRSETLNSKNFLLDEKLRFALLTHAGKVAN